MDIRTYLKDNVLLFDGSMGTYCAEKFRDTAETPCELLNLSNPQKIAAIHKEYIESGAIAIKTNTFGVNRLNMDEDICKKVLTEGFKLSTNAAGDKAFVFADIGPITVTDSQNIAEEYRFVVDTFLSAGATNFLFETNSRLDGLLETASYIKEKNPEAFILLSFASLPDGFTRAGLDAIKLLKNAAEMPFVDAVGFNCASGAKHIADLVGNMEKPLKPLSVMPNAGYPIVLGNRTFYDTNPEYFGSQIGSLVSLGVKIIGGCCGTTPKHISAAAKALKNPDLPTEIVTPKKTKIAAKNNPFWDKLCDPNVRPFAVELDPPEDADIEKFMSGAKELQNAGVDVITIADCPIARARMDASLLACKLKRELGVGVLPHMTCRDRNLNATKALLLGLNAESVHNVLAVTGDPIPSADRDEVKSVYNFNSRMLAGFITALSERGLTTPFNIFAALNVNAKNFDIQLKLAEEKIENGVCGFLTQPVLTKEAFKNLKKARERLDAKILCGIFPLVSYRNACFMDNEVSGVKVAPEIIEMYRDKNRAQAEELAIKISVDIARKSAPYVDGYYLIAPFGRTKLIDEIMKKI